MEMTLIVCILTIVMNIIITIVITRKGVFINTITKARKEHIRAVRDLIAELCHLVSIQGDSDEINRLKYKIKLRLDPSCKEWDGEVIRLIDEITTGNSNNLPETVDQLILISQFLLKLEWTGMRLEGEKGILSDIEKEELRNKNLILYNEYMNNIIQTDKNNKTMTKKWFYRLGLLVIFFAFLLLGYAIGKIVDVLLCEDIACQTLLVGVSIALLIVGVIFLKTYKRLDVYKKDRL
jgi:hypothetical protein